MQKGAGFLSYAHAPNLIISQSNFCRMRMRQIKLLVSSQF